jgi:hypothetical protein
MTAKAQANEVTAKLIGAWELVSWYEIKPDGQVDHPLGNDAQGKIIYTADGHVSAQLVRRNPKHFHNDDWRNASVEESAAAWKDYFGYFGKYSVDEQQQTVTHHIEGSWFPNLVGTRQVRHYRFENSQLILDADTAWGRVRIIWKRTSSMNAD